MLEDYVDKIIMLKLELNLCPRRRGFKIIMLEDYMDKIIMLKLELNLCPPKRGFMIIMPCVVGKLDWCRGKSVTRRRHKANYVWDVRKPNSCKETHHDKDTELNVLEMYESKNPIGAMVNSL